VTDLRVPNFDPDRQLPRRSPVCVYCRNGGWVVVETGNEPANPEDFTKFREAQRLRVKARKQPMATYGEAYAPCPYCDLGEHFEFPPEKPARRGEPKRRMPYGPDGFWASHEWLKTHLRPLEPDSPPNMALNRVEAATLAARVARLFEAVEPSHPDRPTPPPTSPSGAS
jgi:hypothetical protein